MINKEDLSIIGTFNVAPEVLSIYPIYLLSNAGNTVAIQQTGVGERVSLSSFGLDELEPVRFGRKTRTGYIVFLSAIRLGNSIKMVNGIDTLLQLKVENNDLFISGFLFGKSYEYTYKKAVEFKKVNRDTRFEITNDFSKYPLVYDVFKVKNILLPYSQILSLQSNEIVSKVDRLEKQVDEITYHISRITYHIPLTEFLTTNYFTKMHLNKKLVKLTVEYLKEGKEAIERDVMLREFGVDDEYRIQLDIDSEKLSATYPYLSYQCLHRLILGKIGRKEFYITDEELEECREGE